MGFHRLKEWPESFEALLDGRKTFEVRKDDRGYRVGDDLLVCEWKPATTDAWGRVDEHGEHFTGRAIQASVVYMIPGGRFGIDPEYCVMGIVVRKLIQDTSSP